MSVLGFLDNLCRVNYTNS